MKSGTFVRVDRQYERTDVLLEKPKWPDVVGIFVTVISEITSTFGL